MDKNEANKINEKKRIEQLKGNQMNPRSVAKIKIPTKRPFFLYIVSLIFLYALFGPDRIKKAISFVVHGERTTNEILIIPLFIFLIYVAEKITKKVPSIDSGNRNNLPFMIYIYLYIFIIAIGGFNLNSVSQFIYAGLLFVIPMLLFFPMSKCESEHIQVLTKFFVLIGLIYATFAIVLSTNYAYFMDLVGNSTDNYRYYSQYRSSMMLGSSITVSYYFNLTLPMSFYLYFNSNRKIWRLVSALSIITIIIATFILQSRVATISTALILIYSLFFIKNTKKKSTSKMAVVFLIIVAILYAFQNYDLSRIINGLDLSGDSANMRFNAALLGLYIFSQNPVIGSGMGRFFERVYENSLITVDSIIGLIDPHNMYVLILSELGLIGIVLTSILFITFFRRFANIKEKALRRTAYITLVVFLFDAMGGSQLINEISFSVIFWIYMGFFNAVYLIDRNNIGNSNDQVVK